MKNISKEVLRHLKTELECAKQWTCRRWVKCVCEAIPEASKPVKLPLNPSEAKPIFAEIASIGRVAIITARFGNAEMGI